MKVGVGMKKIAIYGKGGIGKSTEKLAELNAYEIFKPDVVLYDVLGDVVCGGFAMPIRDGYADEVCIVTSGEMMSLYAASNIVQAVKSFGKRGYATLRGLILNAKNIDNEQELVAKAAGEMGAHYRQLARLLAEDMDGGGCSCWM